MKPYAGPPATVADVIARIQRPARAVVTAGMPYANGPLHLGHIAGAQLPADIHARWLKLLIGADNVLYVCGTDEHGSATELAALQQGRPVREVLDEVHDAQGATMARYEIGLDVYSGTSRPEAFERHKQRCQEMLRQLYDNGLLKKKTSMQWFDPKLSRFLADRMVRGKCPNPSCDNLDAYSDECGVCGNQHEPTDLVEPRSALSDATPEMRETAHLYLDMWATSDLVLGWLETKKKSWRKVALAEVIETLRPAVSIEKGDEERLKALKDELPPHKRKYTAGKRVQVQADNKHDLEQVRAVLTRAGIPHQLEDGWAHRSISRDIEWGVPLPALDADLKGKTFYVWPDSLIAPIAFTEVALERAGHDPADYRAWWCDPDARIYQFLGQDNVFFYVLMQAALWIGSQKDPTRLPARGELQLNEVFACFHLLVNGKKMSKSVGNFFTGEQLLERGYSSDQLRYYLALLDLGEKPSDFDFAMLDERNAFLSGKMNAVFERPISAALSKFGGRVPQGQLIDDVEKDTLRMVQRYVGAMQKASYPNMLFELENYARKINGLCAKYKPHDDRYPEQQRADALYTAFYYLKNLMIMLRPFVPGATDRLREALRLPPEVFSVEQLGTPLAAGHEVGPNGSYFPNVLGVSAEDDGDG